jgi:hypothetical protein
MARKPKRPQRRRETRFAFEAIAIEGALLQPDLIARIAAAEPTPQLAQEYGLGPGEKLREVVQSKFAEAQSLHGRFLASDRGPKPLARLLTNLFGHVLDFTDLAEVAPIVRDERTFPIGHQGLTGRVPIVLAPYEGIDKGERAFGSDGRQRSPAQLLQEYLNADDGVLWGLVCDGRTLRLYRDNAALTRPAYIEADLAMLLDASAPRLSEFSALWLLVHASRFGKPGTPLTESALERWREDGRKKGAVARDRLRDGVEEALRLLGRGLLAHPANTKLKEELAAGRLSPQGYLDALLRLVYRLIFVFAAEDRGLLHTPRPEEPRAFEAWRAVCDIYRRGYGLARLRELAAKRHSWDANIDGWEGTKILFRELWRGQPRLALPALGGLFAPGAVRDFADCQLFNRDFYDALFHLAWLRTESGLERVNWADMQTEELGSVYESLLELVPNLADPDGFGFIAVAGHERKTTASYYTPDPLVQALLDETLEPLIAGVRPRGSDTAAIDALLDLRIIDPACGSGHFLLAAARRLAMKCAELANPGASPTRAEYRHWLREAARRCLYGVDKNPMAVELAKVALWIETVEPGKPLSFLDAHIRCGDALLGVYDLGALEAGIPDEAYKPLTGDDKKAAAEWRKRNKAERDARAQGQFAFFEPPREVLEAARALEAQSEDALAEVEAKAERFRALMAGPDRYRMEVACDLYCAAFLMPKKEGPMRKAGPASELIPTSRDVWDKLQGGRPLGLLEGRAVDVAKGSRAFHWPLEFPQVFFPGPGRQPGFDLALGNPPWERIKLEEQEFFAGRDARIAKAANQAERRRMIEALTDAAEGSAERMLSDEFQRAKRNAEATSEFARAPGESGGRYPFTGAGNVNTYALFAELFSTVARSAGAIVPTGIATDSTTAPFFAHLFEKQRLAALIDFENREGLFPVVHSAMKFALLVLAQLAKSARFSFFLTNASQIGDERRRFYLSSGEIATINPNTRTAPVFRSRADAELAKQIYTRTPVLIDDAKGEGGNPWGIEVHTRIWHMAEDAEWFRTSKQLTQEGFHRDGRDWVKPDGSVRYVPLYEAKMASFYDHRAGSYESRGDDRGYRVLPETTLAQHLDPFFEAEPYYWVPEKEVEARLATQGWNRGWLTGWKDITSPTNERTMITCVVPRSGVGNKIPLLFPKTVDQEPRLVSVLVSCLCSLVLDFVARQKIGGITLNFFYVKQFPVLPPSAFTDADLAFIVPRVLELTYTSNAMKPFADDLGFKGNAPFPWDEDRRALLRAELDARIARLYGLTGDQLRYILDPSDVMGASYPSETFRVLKKNEMDRYGEYRTRRLVLEAWDRES